METYIWFQAVEILDFALIYVTTFQTWSQQQMNTALFLLIAGGRLQEFT